MNYLCNNNFKVMTKISDLIRDKIDPEHKGFRHTLLYKMLIGLTLLVILGVIYNVFIRRSSTKDLTDDESEEEAARKATLDTFDIVGDYLWPADKTAKPADDANDDDGDAKPIEHEKKKPVAEAASDEDIKNAIGDEDVKTETTSPTDPAAEKKTDAPKVEKMDKPTVEEIE